MAAATPKPTFSPFIFLAFHLLLAFRDDLAKLEFWAVFLAPIIPIRIWLRFCGTLLGV